MSSAVRGAGGAGSIEVIVRPRRPAEPPRCPARGAGRHCPPRDGGPPPHARCRPRDAAAARRRCPARRSRRGAGAERRSGSPCPRRIAARPARPRCPRRPPR
ncbi:hypothetical protein Leucomu_04735 [Leucobacter muris]|uniref:Uncharacterized protein n=1 Tax=Leucobacter muris TaxID=1935379 RepID=A0ABX5QJL5_9MICO|nr:hypothetical protein Leucomu_04735 [Leucobacter muris]